jgi:hypothetical protein
VGWTLKKMRRKKKVKGALLLSVRAKTEKVREDKTIKGRVSLIISQP